MREVDDLVRVRWDICEEGKGRREGKEGRERGKRCEEGGG